MEFETPWKAACPAFIVKMGMSGKTPVGADVGNSAGYWGVRWW